MPQFQSSQQVKRPASPVKQQQGPRAKTKKTQKLLSLDEQEGMMEREDGRPHDGERTGNKAENDAPLWFILLDQIQETRFKDIIS